MSGRRKVAMWAAVMVVVAGGFAALFLPRFAKGKPVLLRGAVIRRDADINKELPIAGAQVTAADGLADQNSKSDASGFFSLTLREGIQAGQPVTLQFRHPGYEPLDWNVIVGENLYVARMASMAPETHTARAQPEVTVTNVIARYSISSTTAANIGSVVKTFQVVNVGNVPCQGRRPCSPDGKWKAAAGSASLDAGLGNELRNARASCIAGPCPFTKVGANGFSPDKRQVQVSGLNWSDTTTFLLEAEVFHPMASDLVRQSYPVIFGQALNFTLPAAAEGVSIEADINGAGIVFPLGPDLILSWANCNARVNKDQNRVYRCELKPGYRFP